MVTFPCSKGDMVTVNGDPGWTVTAMMEGTGGQTFVVVKGMDAKVVRLCEMEVARDG